MNGRINNLQVLRAVAALCVAYLHTNFSILGLKPFGGFGVDVFFVISGFIMAMVVSSGRGEFFRRRVIRVVPLYWAATLLVFVVAAFAPAVLKATRPDVMELVKSLLFIPFRKGNGLIHPVLFLGWTLNYEMFFYVIISASLLIYRRRALLLTSLIIIAVMIANSAISGEWQYSFVEFYSKPVVLDFIAGIVAYRLYTVIRIPATLATYFRVPLLIVACAAFLSMIWIEGACAFAEVTQSAVCGIASFITVLSLAVLSGAGFDTNRHWLIAVGDASYALYIVHPYVEAVIDKFLRGRIPALGLQYVPGLLLALACSLAVAVIVHKKFERPVTTFLSRQLLPRVNQQLSRA